MIEVVEGVVVVVVVVGASPEEGAVEAMAEEAEAMVGVEAEEVIPLTTLSQHSLYAPVPVLFLKEHVDVIAMLSDSRWSTASQLWKFACTWLCSQAGNGSGKTAFLRYR